MAMSKEELDERWEPGGQSLTLYLYSPKGGFVGVFGARFAPNGSCHIDTHRASFQTAKNEGDREDVLRSIEKALYRANEGMKYGGIESRTRKTAAGWEATVRLPE